MVASVSVSAFLCFPTQAVILFIYYFDSFCVQPALLQADRSACFIVAMMTV